MSYCLKPYFKFYSNSCWIDSLFVALFHNNNSLIEDFVKKLELNTKNTNDDEKEVGDQIIKEIKDIFYNIHNTSLDKTCRNIRNLLNSHLNLMRQSNKIIDNNYFSFISVHNNSIDLLKYLFFHIFDINSSNNITSYSWNYNNYSNNNYNSIQNNHTNIFGDKPIYKNINFINLIHNMSNYSSLKDYNLKEELDNLSLHSIIAHIGDHYICYYKCYNEWYIYDDLGINGQADNRTQKIGDLKNVMKNYHDKIEKKKDGKNDERQLQLILLYLNLKGKMAISQKDQREQHLAREIDLIDKQNKKIEEINLRCKSEQKEYEELCYFQIEQTNEERISEIEEMKKSYQDPESDYSFLESEIKEINIKYDNKITKINETCKKNKKNIIEKCNNLITETTEYFNLKLKA